jgi:ketosteroid isomerase-like protein
VLRPGLAGPGSARLDNGPMSSANLDLVRSIFAASERGDYFSSTEWMHPEIEFEIADGPSPTRRTGVRQTTEFWRDFVSNWQDWRVVADDYRELDDERVLVFNHFSGRGRTSGLDIGQVRAEGAGLFHIRDGKVTRLVLYWDRQHALADLGLRE